MASPTEPGATLLDIQTELYSRGYDHLAQDASGVARGLRWINQSYAEVALAELWPFRLTTAVGAAPLAVTDIDRVLYVIDTSSFNNPLYEMQEQELIAVDLTLTGSPLAYYRDSLQIRVWPIGGTLSVRYYALPTDLASPTDTTLVPKRYMDVIVDSVVIRAAKDRDNPDAVALARQERDYGLALMRSQLLVPPTHQWYTGGAFDD